MMKKQADIRSQMLRQASSIQGAYGMLPDYKTLLLVLVCIAADMVFLWDMVDRLFVDDWRMNLIVSLMIAIGLDGLPVVLAVKIRKGQKDWLDYVLLVACTTAFLALILGIFFLRWAMMDTIFGSESGSFTGETPPPQQAKQVMTVIMSIIPLSTSLITFAAATHYSVEQKERQQKQKALIQSMALKQELSAKLQETERELKRDLDDLEWQNYENQKKKLRVTQKVLEEQVRNALAMKLGTPEAVSELLEEEKPDET